MVERKLVEGYSEPETCGPPSQMGELEAGLAGQEQNYDQADEILANVINLYEGLTGFHPLDPEQSDSESLHQQMEPQGKIAVLRKAIGDIHGIGYATTEKLNKIEEILNKLRRELL